MLSSTAVVPTSNERFYVSVELPMIPKAFAGAGNKLGKTGESGAHLLGDLAQVAEKVSQVAR